MRKERKRTRKPSDKRRLERKHLVFYLRVFNEDRTAVVGHLVDISSNGLKLVSDGPIEPGRRSRLRMKLPKEVAGRVEITIEAECIWCRQDSNPDFYMAGFKTAGLGEELRTAIQLLIDDFSIEDNLPSDDSGPPACNLTHTTGN